MTILYPEEIEDVKKLLYYLKSTKDRKLSFLKVYGFDRAERRLVSRRKQEIIKQLEEDIDLSERVFASIRLFMKHKQNSQLD